jgi:urease accessory protein
MKHLHLEVLFAGILLALAMPAEAHTGHGLAYDFQAGLRHPLLGIDHILAMAGVGLWAGFLGGAARVWLPSAFLASMAAGASLPSAGIALQGAEIAVAASVLAIGAILLGIPSKLTFSATQETCQVFKTWQVFNREIMSNNPFGRQCLKLGLTAMLAALFAFGHGYVHALEAGTDSQVLGYAGGFLVSTALLLGIGLVIGRVSRERGYWIKPVFGAICAGAGITLLLGA